MDQTINQEKMITIVYPKTLGDVVPHHLALCELFTTILLKNLKEEYHIKINTKLVCIETNINELKRLFVAFLKTKQLEIFYKQYLALLHKPNGEKQNCIGKLDVIKNNIRFNFYFYEKHSCPDFEWKIVVKKSNLLCNEYVH